MINPNTGRKVNINGRIGKKILANYNQTGGRKITKCEYAEFFWWRIYRNLKITTNLRDSCLHPEQHFKKELLDTPFTKKYLGMCRGKFTGKEADKKIEDIKKGSEKTFQNVLAKCSASKADYEITDTTPLFKLRCRLMELSAIAYMRNNGLIDEATFNSMQDKYDARYSRTTSFTKKDLQEIGAKLSTEIITKTLRKALSNIKQNPKKSPKKSKKKSKKK